MVKNLPAIAGGHRLDPWSRKIPQAAGQLSPWVTATEAHESWGPGSATEKPLQREARTRQLEKAQAAAKKYGDPDTELATKLL